MQFYVKRLPLGKTKSFLDLFDKICYNGEYSYFFNVNLRNDLNSVSLIIVI